jgi:hypothetical protein
MGRGPKPPSHEVSADELHHHFDSKAAQVVNFCEGSEEPTFFSAPVDCEFESFNKISIYTVISTLQRLPNKTSPKDPLRTFLLKDCVDLLAPFIAYVFNLSLSTGVFPKLWKVAVITPVLKKDKVNPGDVNSYRPISKLCILSKALEKLVASQLCSHLHKFALIPTLQSAYRQYHSTESAILKLTSDIFHGLDKGCIALLSFLDLSSAFDSVDHEILLNRLKVSFGVKGTVLNWFHSFLCDRVQSVSFRSSSSTPCTSLCGVPQGSVLGPLLFILYASDLLRLAKPFDLQMHMYADDIQLYGFSSPSQTYELRNRVSSCIDAIIAWCRSNQLKLNVEKSEVMWCSSKKMRNRFSCQSVRFGDVFLNPSTSVRCLGVFLDPVLSFDTHVTKTVSICFGMLRQIRSIRRSVSKETLSTLIVALVFSRADYCISSFSGILSSHIKRLQSVFNAAARLIFRESKFSHVTPLLQQLQWLPVKARIDLRLAQLVHSCLQGAAPEYLCKELTKMHHLPGRPRLRSSSSNTLLAPRVRRPTIGGRGFQAAAPRVWNTLPSHLRSDVSSSFKNNLKDYFLKTALNR